MVLEVAKWPSKSVEYIQSRMNQYLTDLAYFTGLGELKMNQFLAKGICELLDPCIIYPKVASNMFEVIFYDSLYGEL